MERWHDLRPRWARKAGLSMAKGRVVNFEHVRSWDGAKGKLAYMSKDAPHKMLAVFEPFINPRTGKPLAAQQRKTEQRTNLRLESGR
jgi:hypothetical protein